MLDYGTKAHPGILPPIDWLALSRVPMVLTFERLEIGCSLQGGILPTITRLTCT